MPWNSGRIKAAAAPLAYNNYLDLVYIHHPAHIQENINIFDFALTDEEMAAIRAIDLGEGGRSFNLRYGDMNFGAFQDYPYHPTARK